MIRQELAPEFAFTDPLQGPSGENALSNEQLALRIKGGEDHYILQLMRQNRGLFHKLAKPFVAYGRIDVDEIANLSFFAVCSAVSYWDSNMGCTFSTVLGNRFTFELLEAANRCRNAPLPRTERERLHRFYKLRREYLERFGREPCDDEIMKSLKITSEQLKDLRQCVAIQDNAMRLDAPAESEDDTDDTMIDFVEDSHTAPVDELAVGQCYQSALREALEAALADLPPDQNQAIRSRYFEDGAADTKTIHNGLTALSKERQLAGFLNENFFSCTGETYFKDTWMTAPERFAMRHGVRPRRKGERP